MRPLLLLLSVFAVGFVPATSFFRTTANSLATAEQTFLYHWYTNDTFLTSTSTSTSKLARLPITQTSLTRTLTSKLLYYMSFGASRPYLLHRQWDAYDKVFLEIVETSGLTDTPAEVINEGLRSQSPFMVFLELLYFNYAYPFYVQRTSEEILKDDSFLDLAYELSKACNASDLTETENGEMAEKMQTRRLFKIFYNLPLRMKFQLLKYVFKLRRMSPYIEDAMASDDVVQSMRDYLMRTGKMNTTSPIECSDCINIIPASFTQEHVLKKTEELEVNNQYFDNGLKELFLNMITEMQKRSKMVQNFIGEIFDQMTEWEAFYARVSHLSKKTKVAMDTVVKQVYPRGPAIENCVRSLDVAECVHILFQTIEKTSGTTKEYVQTVLEIVQGKELDEAQKKVFEKQENAVVGIFYPAKEAIGLKKAKYPPVFTEVEGL